MKVDIMFLLIAATSSVYLSNAHTCTQQLHIVI